MSQLSLYLQANTFCILLEYLTSLTENFAVKSLLAGYPTVMTLADRVHSDEDMPPLKASLSCPESIDKVIHYSGKNRDINDFKMFLDQAATLNIENLLLLTGDKLKKHCDGNNGLPRTRYLESVNAVSVAKQYGIFNLGVAFNPFKYAEAERDAQYLKLQKKLKAGADFIVAQVGYDMDALKQAKAFLKNHHYTQKILACIMPLGFARASFIVKHQIAGIVITTHMLKVLADEKQAGITENIYKRCALQILMCQHIGFAGIHLSACHKPDEQMLIEFHIEQYQHLNLDELESIWNSLWSVSHGKEFVPECTLYSQQPTSKQLMKYHQLNFIHGALFDSQLAQGIGRFIFKKAFWQNTFATKALLKVEYFSKHSIVGCESCGQCRLGETLYICPETCPKGLANGPCGGTSLDRCEFGDRECIHSVKARLAKAVGQADVLKEKLIPTIPIEVRGTSSWKNWYLDIEA